MAFVITDACIDVMDRTCIKECPVDCIYEGGRALYINPVECIDCGACQPVCPSDAIYHEDDLPDALKVHQIDNSRFFTDLLPGYDTPLRTPMGARAIGRVGVDTELVRNAPLGTD